MHHHCVSNDGKCVCSYDFLKETVSQQPVLFTHGCDRQDNYTDAQCQKAVDDGIFLHVDGCYKLISSGNDIRIAMFLPMLL